MNKYIDSEKLKAEIERLSATEYGDNTFGDDVANGALDYVLEEIIPSLQQEQPIQVNTLTWRDINDLERIINNVHYEFRNGIGEKSFGEEVLERFREERDEQEQPEADLKKEYKEYVEDDPVFSRLTNRNVGLAIARHFYELGLSRAAGMYDETEYNKQRAEED